MEERIIQCTDEVKNREFEEVIGRVIDKYPSKENPQQILLDVETPSGFIYYGSPIERWFAIAPTDIVEPEVADGSST